MARKDVNIVSSLVGKGLEREALLLRDFLIAHDIYTVFIHYTDYSRATLARADVTMFLEVVMPNALHLAKENWLLPNSEWWGGVNDRFVPMFTKVLGKTEDCVDIWKKKLAGDRPERVSFLGFESRDLYDEKVDRSDKFLHVAGESEFKNTEAVLAAWNKPSWPIKPVPLTVVCRQKKFSDILKNSEFVTCLDKVSDAELKQLMNSHRYHVMPSSYEGFGHSLHESISCGALVVTTDARPMKDFLGVQVDCLVPVSSTSMRSLATMNTVSPDGVIATCAKLLSIVSRQGEAERRSAVARSAFLSDRDSFRSKLLSLLEVE